MESTKHFISVEERLPKNLDDHRILLSDGSLTAGWASSTGAWRVFVPDISIEDYEEQGLRVLAWEDEDFDEERYGLSHQYHVPAPEKNDDTPDGNTPDSAEIDGVPFKAGNEQLALQEELLQKAKAEGHRQGQAEAWELIKRELKNKRQEADRKEQIYYRLRREIEEVISFGKSHLEV